MTLWHLKALLCYMLANCVLPWYAIWRNKRLRPNKERDLPKYLPFVRNDYDTWSYLECIWTHFFFLPRYIILLLILIYASLVTKIITIGCDIENLDETRRKLILDHTCFAMRVFGPIFGCLSFTTERPKVDYSKWLGPDWKPNYDGATMYVSNHMSWNEMFNTFLFARPMPGFIAKHGVKEIPSVGVIATCIRSVFMDRTSKELRHKVFEIIEERQKKCEQGLAPPLLIFPEGCTTNGQYLLSFKSGAFASLKPVKPYINKTNCNRCNQAMGSVLNLWHWTFVVPFKGLFYSSEQLELPVFAPNEYFWKHHWDGKDEKEKWKVFANAVREEMAKAGGFQLSDSTMDTKMEYKNLVWGKIGKDV